MSFPEPARSRAVTPGPAAASRTTAMFSWASPVLASTAGRAGPAGNQPLPVSPKMPTVPGWLQLAATIGAPALLNVAAVRPVSPQARPAAVAATVFALARRFHDVPDLLPNSTSPPLVSARTWPAGVAASASGAAARPGVGGPAAGDQLVPLLVLDASGENVRSWLVRNPVIMDPPPAPATTRPPLSATPGGVASRQRVAPAGRTNSCQKLLCCAAEPPISTTAQPASLTANDVASGGAGGAAACSVLAAGALLQPAASRPATASAVTASPLALMATSGLAGRHW